MSKRFNTTGLCVPERHYMVNLESRLAQIRELIDSGCYFTINRARQYGKTTTLRLLSRHLLKDYYVVSMDFQTFSYGTFRDEKLFSSSFANAFLRLLMRNQLLMTENLEEAVSALKRNAEEPKENFQLMELFEKLGNICAVSEKPVVLIIDEVDSASNNQVFLDFLAQLRAYYIDRDVQPTFQSVILAGVYDIKNLKQKLRPDWSHKTNSPWNIATDFSVDMSFHHQDIAGMLAEYEADWHTGMDLDAISSQLLDYTSGYPFLVSRLCQLVDEQLAGSRQFPTRTDAWTDRGIREAVRLILSEKNTLFESLIGKINDYPELKNLLYRLLFNGQKILYNPDDEAIGIAQMFGFVRTDQNGVMVANRIFETRLYNYFLTSSRIQDSAMYQAASRDENQFIRNGHLDMTRILEKFVFHFHDLYGNQTQQFLEEDGRRYFLLYLRPIINGTGNYYIEAQTRNRERTDVIVDYGGEQFVIELKIWRGNAYNKRGEAQLLDYLDYYHVKKGYMLSFNFNKNKKIGVREILLGDKLLVEAVV